MNRVLIPQPAPPAYRPRFIFEGGENRVRYVAFDAVAYVSRVRMLCDMAAVLAERDEESER